MAWVRLGTAMGAGLLASCSLFPTDGGNHGKGEWMSVARMFHGEPIVGRALWWIGDGDVPNHGASVQTYFFPLARLAAGIGVDWIRFQVPGKDFGGWEFEGRLRSHCVEIDGLGIFFDLNGGWMAAKHEMPPGGTRSNYTVSFGPGLELPVGSVIFLLGGCELHHWSNGRGTGERATDNPAQNVYLPWMGVGLRW